MLKVDIIICKGIVINLYDIIVAINFFLSSLCRGPQVTASRTSASVYTDTRRDLAPLRVYVHYGDVCYVKCINIAKIIYDLI